MHDMMYGGEHWVMWWLAWGAVLVLVGLVLLLAVRSTRTESKGEPSQSDKSPLDILKERYARGEIDDAEFEEKRKRLQD